MARHGPVATTAGEVVLAVALSGVLALALATQLAEAPAVATGWRVAAALVLLALLGVGVSAITAPSSIAWPRLVVVAVAGGLLIERLLTYRHETFAAGAPALFELLLVGVLLAALVLAVSDTTAFTPLQWGVTAGLAVVVSLFLGHLLGLAGPAPAWPIWASVAAVVATLVVPRVVPERCFLWAVATVGAVAAMLAIAAAILGEFTLAGHTMHITDQTVPLLDLDLDGWRAHAGPFNNVNVMGLIAFAGLVSSVLLAHRAVRRIEAAAAGGCVLLAGTALVLSSSGAAWIAAGVALGLYTAVVLVGRDAAWWVFLASALGTIAAIVVAYVGDLPVDDSGRYIRWRSSLLAFADDPSLLGHGHVSTAGFIADHLGERSAGTPHNSYLSILIRLGIVGALAYVAVVVGSLVVRARRATRTNLGLLAFALGWAVHHLFESYTLLQWTAPALLTGLTLGYLVFGRPDARIGPVGPLTRSGPAPDP